MGRGTWVLLPRESLGNCARSLWRAGKGIFSSQLQERREDNSLASITIRGPLGGSIIIPGFRVVFDEALSWGCFRLYDYKSNCP